MDRGSSWRSSENRTSGRLVFFTKSSRGVISYTVLILLVTTRTMGKSISHLKG